MNYIAIFAKPPIAGVTKGRLAADIGNELAAELSGAMLYDITYESTCVKNSKTVIFYPPGYFSRVFTRIRG